MLDNKSVNQKVDIMVGIPSYNEADNIDFVVKQVDKGLRKYYAKAKAVIINVDNNSPDGTKEVFEQTKTLNPKLYISTKKGITGKGYNFYNLFKKAREFKAKVVIVVDADLQSISPEWVRELGEPITKNNYDFVTPIYARHEYDGSITNHIVYPLVYGLLGYNIRQPIGGDFAMSGKLVDYLLKQKWIKTTKKYGIDVFLTLNAVLGGFKIAQTNLGAKIHKPSAPKLGPMFSQVSITLFSKLVEHRSAWQRPIRARRVPVFYQKRGAKPQDLSIDYKAIKATALYLFSINRSYLKKYLAPENFQELSRLYSHKEMDIDKELWSRVVYDMLYAFDKLEINSHFAEAFKPLYFGRVASFIKQTLELNYKQSEQEIIKQAKVFYKNRDYLLAKYK